MRLPLPPLLGLLAACVASSPDGGGAASDAGTDGALTADTGSSGDAGQDAWPDGLLEQLYPSLDAGPECGEVEWLSSSLVQRRLELDAWCELFADLVTCPGSREAFVPSVVTECGVGNFFPSLRRRCGLDEIETFVGDARLVWRFDSATGALRGARVLVQGPGQPCPEGVYLGGDDNHGCIDAAQDCALCESGPERDAQCPAEVLALVPSVTCEAPAQAPGCACEGNEFFSELPEPGAPCGDPVTCDSCTSGTCWSDCVCGIDGASRWRLRCSE